MLANVFQVLSERFCMEGSLLMGMSFGKEFDGCLLVR